MEMPSSSLTGQPSINGVSAILVELNSGAVLYSKNIHRQMCPASTTKVMTALMTLENLSLSDSLTISYKATHDLIEGGFDERFKEGQVYTIEEALYGLCLNSVNTLGYALAEKMAGDVPSFAAMMNKRAAELGALHTSFTNPHGLNDMKHLTTVYDMAKILWAAIEIDTYRTIAGTPSYTCADLKDGQKMVFPHTLRLLQPESPWYDSRVVCGKTGWTEDASFCRAVYAKEGGRDLICVVFYSEGGGGDNVESDVEKLLNYGFSFPDEKLISFQSDYTLKDGYLTAVGPDVTVGAFASHFSLKTSGSWLLTDESNRKRGTNELVRTGDQLRVYDTNNILQYKAQVLIFADVNGDGKINISDLIKVRNHILQEQMLQAVYRTAADVNGDGKINISDLIKIRNHILGESIISQGK